jgi:hypothetical protein
MDDGWSLDELTERVAHALASDGVRAPNGRVRELPDARAIRWYTTIGLVDRPLVGPRRSARYTDRHLLQLVAVKRLQAAGLSLAEIQAELVGATETALRAVARLPETDLPAQGNQPAAAAITAPMTAPMVAPAAAPQAPRARFWAAPPRPAPDTVTPVPVVQYVVTLPGGVSLTLPAAPGGADLAAIQDAAAPLLQLLAARGLTASPNQQT